LVALEQMTERLGDDHIRARRLAEGLALIPGVRLDMGLPQTNMVFVSLAEEIPLDARQVAQRLLEWKVKVGVVGERRFRLVTHYWITDEAVEAALTGFRTVLQAA
jgi:threonine aldolase